MPASASNDSIGFMLQLDDQLSGTIAKAAKSYETFTKKLSVLNTKAEKSVNSSFSAMTQLAKSFAKFPEDSVKAYNRAYASMKRNVKPLKQTIDLVVSQKGSKAFSDTIARAVGRALSKATFRMSPVLPNKRAKGFDNGQALKTAYLNQTQPADMAGSLKVPRFSKGGDVKGGSRKGFDDVLALLSKNEMVLPSTEADMLRKIAKKKTMSTGMSRGMSDLHNLSIAIDKLTSQGSATNIGALRKAVGLSGRASSNLNAAYDKLPQGQRDALGARLGTSQAMLALSVKNSKALLWNMSVTGKVVNALSVGFTKVQKTLKGIQTDTKFIAFAKLWETWRKNAKDGAKHLQHALGTDSPVQNFFDNMNQANRTLHLSRMELYGMRTTMIEMAKNGPGVLNPTIMGETVNEMIDAGMRMQTISKFAGLTALSTQAMRINLGTAASLTRIMADNMHLDKASAAGMFAGLSKTAEAGPNSAETLAERALQNRRNMGGAFANIMDPNQKRDILQNMAALGQAAEKNFGDTDNHISTMLAKAADRINSPEGLAISSLLGIQGPEILNRLKSKQGTIGIIEAIGAKIRSFGTNTTNLNTINETMHLGFDNVGDMINFGREAGNIVNDFGNIADGVNKIADPWAKLNEDAAKGKSWTERMQNFIVNWSYSKAQPILDFFHEFNFMQAASAVYLAKNIYNMTKMGTIAKWAGKTLWSTFSKTALGESVIPALEGLGATMAAGLAPVIAAVAGLSAVLYGLYGIYQMLSGVGDGVDYTHQKGSALSNQLHHIHEAQMAVSMGAHPGHHMSSGSFHNGTPTHMNYAHNYGRNTPDIPIADDTAHQDMEKQNKILTNIHAAISTGKGGLVSPSTLNKSLAAGDS